MDDFSAKVGVPNAFGVIGNANNAMAQGQRMLSSMTPSMLLRDGKVALWCCRNPPGTDTPGERVSYTHSHIIAEHKLWISPP